MDFKVGEKGGDNNIFMYDLYYEDDNIQFLVERLRESIDDSIPEPLSPAR